jgi:hypothetical protein
MSLSPLAEISKPLPSFLETTLNSAQIFRPHQPSLPSIVIFSDQTKATLTTPEDLPQVDARENLVIPRTASMSSSPALPLRERWPTIGFGSVPVRLAHSFWNWLVKFVQPNQVPT